MTVVEPAPTETGRPQKYVGSRVKRVEDRRLLLGHSKYLPDLEVPGMTHAAFLRSPHAHAKILSIDTTEAQNLEGVVAIFTGALTPNVAPAATSARQNERRSLDAQKSWRLSRDHHARASEP